MMIIPTCWWGFYFISVPVDSSTHRFCVADMIFPGREKEIQLNITDDQLDEDDEQIQIALVNADEPGAQTVKKQRIPSLLSIRDQ